MHGKVCAGTKVFLYSGQIGVAVHVCILYRDVSIGEWERVVVTARERFRLLGREEDDGWTGSCLQMSAAGIKPYKHTTLTYQSWLSADYTAWLTYSTHSHKVWERQRENSGWKRARGWATKTERCQGGRRQTCGRIAKSLGFWEGSCVDECVYACTLRHPSPTFFCPVAIATIILMLVCLWSGNVKSTSRQKLHCPHFQGCAPAPQLRAPQ